MGSGVKTNAIFVHSGMKPQVDFPRYPPRWLVKIFTSLRESFLRMNRRFTHPNVVLWEMVHNFWFAAGLGVVAELGIADFLKEGPKNIRELADASGSNRDALYRVMRMLASQGIFREQDKGVFALTRLAEPLREDRIRYLLLIHLSPGHFRYFADILEVVRAGHKEPERNPGKDLFDHIADEKERNRRFNMAMSNATAMQVPALLSAYPFERYHQIMDLGGGQGLFLATLLTKYKHCHGLLFDLPAALNESVKVIDGYGLHGRMEAIGGNLFDEVPGGGDLYILKSVLHDWRDEDAGRILENVRKAMGDHSRLLIIENVLEEDNRPSFGKMTDILMMVTAGGKERTRAEWEGLLSASGFQVKKIYPTITPHSLVEAVKVTGNFPYI